MSDDLNTRQRYLLEKRQGYTDEEAADRAGFSGRPGGDARRLVMLAEQEVSGEHQDIDDKAEALAELVGADPSTRVYRRAKLEQAVQMAESLRREAKLRVEALEALSVEGCE